DAPRLLLRRLHARPRRDERGAFTPVLEFDTLLLARRNELRQISERCRPPRTTTSNGARGSAPCCAFPRPWSSRSVPCLLPAAATRTIPFRPRALPAALACLGVERVAPVPRAARPQRAVPVARPRAPALPRRAARTPRAARPAPAARAVASA